MPSDRKTPSPTREPKKPPMVVDETGRLSMVGATVFHPQGEEAFIELRRTQGMPRIFKVVGNIKCLICDGFSQTAVCEDCSNAVKLLRSANFTAKLRTLLDHQHLELVLDIASKLVGDKLSELLVREFHEGD